MRTTSPIGGARRGIQPGAAAALEESLADRRVLGPDHLNTDHAEQPRLLAGRGGNPAAAIAMLEELLADQLRVLGPDHPDT